MRWYRAPLLLIVAASLATLACQTRQPVYSADDIENYVYKKPARLGDGWETAEVDPSVISISMVEEGIRAIMRGGYPNFHSVLIAHNGKLIFEEYFPGHNKDGEWIEFDHSTPHFLASITKSITALVFGIAIDRGEIETIDASVLDWFPEYQQADRTEKKAITIRHLLTMKSGLEWNEHSVSYFSRNNDLNKFYSSRDPIDFVLGKELVHQPGIQFTYNSGAVKLLGEIVYQETNRRVDEYAKEFLFDPLGIDDIEWERSHPDLVDTSGGLSLRPRDLLKIGELILQAGMWDGERIISEEWLEQTMSRYSALSEELDYGFMWVVPKFIHPDTGQPIISYAAGGRGGQWLVIYPGLDCLVVLTAMDLKEGSTGLWHNDFILPALVANRE